jgi:polar amino acid transport system substrate-binding protein
MASLHSWLPILASGALAVIPAGQLAAGEVLDRVMTRGVMVMSTDAEYPPQSSLNSAGEFEGFDIDVGREIAERLGVAIEFVTPGWEVITSGRWNGRWDVSVGSMTPTEARAQVLDFPAVYYYTPASLAVHEDNTKIAAPADASGMRIGVGVATTYENYLRKDLTIYGEDVPAIEFVIDDAAIQTYETDLNALDDLRLGDGVRLDAAMTALPTLLAAIKGGYPLKVVGDPLFREPLSVATEKGDDAWNARLAEIIATMRDDGTLRALSEKWYGADLTG